MGFLRFRFIFLGRRLIPKLEWRFLERKNESHKINTQTCSNLKRSRSGDRNSILMSTSYVLRESFQGKYPLQSLMGADAEMGAF